MNLRRTFAETLLLLLTLGSMGDVRFHARASESQQAGHRAIVLLPGCQIVVVDLVAGTVLVRQQLADSLAWRSGESLARSPDDDAAYVTLISKHGLGTTVVRIALTDYAFAAIASVPGPAEYPWIAVGPRTKRLFLATTWGFRVVALERDAPTTVTTFPVRADTMMYGPIMWYAISGDESRLYASYHGNYYRGSGGVDWAAIDGASMKSCTERRPSKVPRTGCAGGHGKVVGYNAGFLAATGGGLATFDSIGNKTSAIDVALPFSHFMEFALDTVRNVAYGISPCRVDNRTDRYPPSPGLSRVSLTDTSTSRARVINAQACGNRVEVSSDGSVLAAVAGSLLRVLDAATGVQLTKISLNEPVVDLLVP